jgi:hypothetical protein
VRYPVVIGADLESIYADARTALPT